MIASFAMVTRKEPASLGSEAGSGRRSARRVPDDDFLQRVVAGGWSDIAVNGAELRSRQRDRDIFRTGVLGEAVPAGAQLKAVLAAADPAVRLVFLGLPGVLAQRDLGGVGEGGKRAFQDAVLLVGEVSGCGESVCALG